MRVGCQVPADLVLQRTWWEAEEGPSVHLWRVACFLGTGYTRTASILHQTPQAIYSWPDGRVNV